MKQSLESEGNTDSTQQSQHKKEPPSSLKPIHAAAPVNVNVNPNLKLTSDYFVSDHKPILFRRNSGRANNVSFRVNAPSRTDSWRSHGDNSISITNHDDADGNSLASELESTCSIRDFNNSFTRDIDFAPVPPASQPSPAASKSILPSPDPDHHARFSAGRTSTGTGTGSSSCEANIRKTMVVSWNNGSNKDASLSRLLTESVRTTSRERLPILPFAKTQQNTSTTKFCMPAPLNRTPSNNGSLQG